MKRRTIWILAGIVVLLALGSAVYIYGTIREKGPGFGGSGEVKTNATEPIYIAHGGGGYLNLTYTNSYEAVVNSYNSGYRWIEVDISPTEDGEYVLLHDWDRTLNKYFNETGRKTLSEFVNLRMSHDLTQMTFSDIAQWIHHHPEVTIIWDIKGNCELEFCTMINDTYPEFLENTIPQVLDFDTYHEIEPIGFERIIYAHYDELKYFDSIFMDNLNETSIYAVSLNTYVGQSTIPYELEMIGKLSFVYPVNDPELMKQYTDNYADGFYTDLPYIF